MRATDRQTDKETDRHTHHNTLNPSWGRSSKHPSTTTSNIC